MPVELDVEVRIGVCRAFVWKWRSSGFRIVACSVGERHQHVIVEGPDDYLEMTKRVGRCKQKASHSVRHLLPGTIWAANGGFKPIRGPGALSQLLQVRAHSAGGGLYRPVPPS